MYQVSRSLQSQFNHISSENATKGVKALNTPQKPLLGGQVGGNSLFQHFFSS